MEDAEGRLWGETLEVFLARGDDESCHIEGTGTDEVLSVCLGVVAVGTVLPAWEHHGEVLVVAPPTDDVHHRLRLVLMLRQGVVEAQEQLFVTIL